MWGFCPPAPPPSLVVTTRVLSLIPSVVDLFHPLVPSSSTWHLGQWQRGRESHLLLHHHPEGSLKRILNIASFCPCALVRNLGDADIHAVSVISLSPSLSTSLLPSPSLFLPSPSLSSPSLSSPPSPSLLPSLSLSESLVDDVKNHYTVLLDTMFVSFLPQQVQLPSEEGEEGGEEGRQLEKSSSAHPLHGLPPHYHHIADSLKSKVRPCQQLYYLNLLPPLPLLSPPPLPLLSPPPLPSPPLPPLLFPLLSSLPSTKMCRLNGL